MSQVNARGDYDNEALLPKASGTSSKVKVLLGFFIIATIGLTVGVVVLAVQNSNKGSDNDDGGSPSPPPPGPSPSSICSTQACLQAAAGIAARMNATADPCNDFYDYACGGWMASTDIPEGLGTWGSFQETQERNDRAMRRVLDAGPNNGPYEEFPGTFTAAGEGNNSTGTGFYTLTFDPVGHTLHVVATFYDLVGNVTIAHIHCCTAAPNTGNAAPATMVPTFPGFPDGTTSGHYDQSFNTSDASTYNPAFITANGGSVAAAEAALIAGLQTSRAYFNIHTTLYPGGEIRGYSTFTRVYNQKIFDFYASCLDTTTIDSLGSAPLTPYLTALDSATTVDELLAQMGGFAVQGMPSLISVSVNPDMKNPSQSVLSLGQGGLSLPSRDYYISSQYTSVIATYNTTVQNVFTALGVTEPLEQAASVFVVETRIAQISLPLIRNPELTYNNMSLANVTADAGLTPYLTAMGVEIDGWAIVSVPTFYADLGPLLAGLDVSALRSYAKWRVIYQSVAQLSSSLRDLVRPLQVAVGDLNEPPRWKTCVSNMNTRISFMADRLFVDATFDENARASAIAMIQGVQQALKAGVSTLSWMTPETKAVTAEKVDAIYDLIGYSDFVKNDTFLTEYFAPVTISPTTFYANARSAQSNAVRKNLNLRGQPTDKSVMSNMAQVNAFYSSTFNRIAFPAGILQPIFFSENYLKALNYGGVGMVVGHEITHGFDDQGRNFDKDGFLRQWWDNATIAAFTERAQCMMSQYSGYTINGLRANGNQTIGENIADNGGIKYSFRAYKTWLANNGGTGEQLPVLGLSSEKLFFINFAQVWCAKYTPEVLERRILTGVHSPGPLRVLGPLSNLDDFAETFQCAPGTNYNPVHKCTVW